MQVFREDVKSGIFILVAAGIFLFAVFRIGGVFQAFRPSRQLTLEFADAGQVDAGAELLFRGKTVGRVEEVTFSDRGESVLIRCAVEPKTPLYEGTMARIVDKSALGGKMIELVPASESGKALPDGAVIPGLPSGGLAATLATLNELLQESKGRTEQIFDKLDRVLENLDGTITEARAQLGQLGKLRPKADEALESYIHLAKRLDGKIGELTVSLDRTLNTVNPAVTGMQTDFHELAAGLRSDAAAVRAGVETLMANANKLLLDTDAVIADNYADLSESLLSLKIAIRNFQDFTSKISARPYLVLRKSKRALLNPPALTDEEEAARELRETGHMGRKGTGSDEEN